MNYELWIPAPEAVHGKTPYKSDGERSPQGFREAPDSTGGHHSPPEIQDSGESISMPSKHIVMVV